jgi:hypothetical protein
MIKHQDTLLEINGHTFRADSPLAPLLKELNRVGLRTLFHCAGGLHDAYIVFDADCLTDIEINNNEYGRHLTIRFPAVKV